MGEGREVRQGEARMTRTLLLALTALASAPVAAQPFPAKPVRIVVGFTAGGPTDIVARTVGQKLSEAWSQPVVIDNRAGAGGVIATEQVARAPADGYTMLMGTIGGLAVAMSLQPNRGYDTLRDFAPVTQAVTVTNILAVHPTLPARTVKELLALAKARPGQLTYASSGNFLYLSGALFTSMAKVEMLHVPFKGGSQAMPAVMSGEVALSFATIVSSLPPVSGGKLRGLAVTSARRFPGVENVPTVAESGLPGYEAVAWYGAFAPAGTPREIVRELNADMVRIVNAPDVRELFLRQGAESYATSPEEFAKVVERDVAKWGRVVRESGANAD
jgi:tripartite-type tricarboxylate transporter receptor subunit TctC